MSAVRCVCQCRWTSLPDDGCYCPCHAPKRGNPKPVAAEAGLSVKLPDRVVIVPAGYVPIPGAPGLYAPEDLLSEYKASSRGVVTYPIGVPVPVVAKSLQPGHPFADLNREPAQTLAGAKFPTTGGVEKRPSKELRVVATEPDCAPGECDHHVLALADGARYGCAHCGGEFFRVSDPYEASSLRDLLGDRDHRIAELERENAALALELRRATRGVKR